MTAASASFTDFNAWTDPWVPITGAHGSSVVSLRDALALGHECTDLGTALYPLAREALLRLLTSTAATGLAHLGPDEVDDYGFDGIYPPAALARLDMLKDRFFLRHPTTPFLQAWAHHADPADVVSPLAVLDPHTPGAKSSQWAVRRAAGTSPSDPGAMTPAAVALGLTVAWFHTKWSNANGPTGMVKCIAGAPGYAKGSDLTFHWLGTTLGLTVAAGIPLSWTEKGPVTVAAWLDQDHYPTGADLAADPSSLWRATYTPNRPVLVWSPDTEAPTGFIIGCVAGASRPVPEVAPSRAAKVDLSTTGKPGQASPYTKAAISQIHTRSTTRAYRDVAKPGQVPLLLPVTSTTHRLISAEAATVWFASGHANDLAAWGTNRVAPAHASDPAWKLGCYVEESNQSKRTQSNWVTVDPALLTIAGPPGDAVTTVLAYAAAAHKHLRAHTRAVVTGGESDPAVDKRLKQGHPLEGTVTAVGTTFYARLDDLVLTLLSVAAGGGVPDIAEACRTIAENARAQFAAVTDPLRTPSRLGLVETTRASLIRSLIRAMPRTERRAQVPTVAKRARPKQIVARAAAA